MSNRSNQSKLEIEDRFFKLVYGEEYSELGRSSFDLWHALECSCEMMEELKGLKNE